MAKGNKTNTKATFFEIIDGHLFYYVDQFLKSSFYQKVTDKLSDFGQKEQKFINHALTILAAFVPLLITALFFYQNVQLKDELDLKKGLLEKIHSYQQSQAKVDALGGRISSPITISDQGDFYRSLSSRLRRRGIEKKKVKIVNFSQMTQTPSFAESSIKLQLQGLTLTELADLFNFLIGDFKMRTTLIELKRNDQNETIQGMVELMHYKRI